VKGTSDKELARIADRASTASKEPTAALVETGDAIGDTLVPVPLGFLESLASLIETHVISTGDEETGLLNAMAKLRKIIEEAGGVTP
jgi:hypothetical protein